MGVKVYSSVCVCVCVFMHVGAHACACCQCVRVSVSAPVSVSVSVSVPTCTYTRVLKPTHVTRAQATLANRTREFSASLALLLPPPLPNTTTSGSTPRRDEPTRDPHARAPEHVLQSDGSRMQTANMTRGILSQHSPATHDLIAPHTSAPERVLEKDRVFQITASPEVGTEGVVQKERIFLKERVLQRRASPTSAPEVVMVLTCGQGYTRGGRACAPCEVGKYKEQLDNSSCFSCGLHATSA